MIKWKHMKFVQLLVAVTAAFRDGNADSDKKHYEDERLRHYVTPASNKRLCPCRFLVSPL